MQKFKMIALAAIAPPLLCVAGCSHQSSLDDALTDQPIVFTVDLQTSDLPTRAGHVAGDLSDGELGLFLSTDGTADSKYNASNMKVTGSEGVWTPESTLLWKSSSTPVEYYAYLPYRETLDNGNLVPVSLSANQSAESILGEDLLYTSAQNVLAKDNPNGIALEFKHKLAQLKVVLKKGTEVEESLEIPEVTLANCLLSGSMDVTTGEVTSGTNASDVSMFGSKSPIDNPFTNIWETLLVPGSFSAGKFAVTIAVGSGVDQRQFRYQISDAVTLEGGNSYTLNLIVGRDKVEMGDIKAEEWTPIDGGGLVTD